MLRIVRLVLSWLFLVALATVGLLRRSGPSGRPEADPPRHSPMDTHSAYPPEFSRLLLSWIVLLLLGAAQFAASFLPLGRSLRPLVMVPGVLMVVVVAVSFMEVGKGPTIVRGFAVAAIFWLIVLLGLGSADVLTQTLYHVPHANVD